MAVPLRSGLSFRCVHETGLERKETDVPGFDVLSWKNDIKGRRSLLKEPRDSHEWRPQSHPISPIHGQNTSMCAARAFRWWEKNTSSNMTEIESTNQLVHSLLHAEDKLVIVDFYSPGCGGCKALHPKICQQAEMNPSVMLLRVNYEEHKAMCRSLHIHVLPFFRFYRGAQGRVCAFSCTNATISKFNNALAKHGMDRCSLGPAKGLEEGELLSLASNPDAHFGYPWRSLSQDLALSIPDESSVGEVEAAAATAALALRGSQIC
ncbi:thioredoxin-like 1-2, chloroplastic [Musa acuminata AAA Group]|uniref:thioredoxin-like 1-2, chloroplastic n=1 Tax=Musa acuminata AAA Group TaxID=214697 RepID=UPI0031D1D400